MLTAGLLCRVHSSSLPIPDTQLAANVLQLGFRGQPSPYFEENLSRLGNQQRDQAVDKLELWTWL